jgi:drug/metabolite transporter (DMT)-like permease
MNIVNAILLKIISTLLFAVMSALVRWLGDSVPLGQVVFFRSAVAIVPVVIIYALRGELWAAVRTSRPFGHVSRGVVGAGGMFFNFAALARLPIADATAISFSSPLITVALAGLLLGERVRIYRWSAVIAGLIGVFVMLAPRLSVGQLSAMTATAALGSVFALIGAICGAGAVIQTRRLTDSETTSAIVLYFSVFCALAGLATLPFGWTWPTPSQLLALIMVGVLGGVSHLLLTESYRHAPASLVAPFDYMAMLWALVLGYFIFDEIPDVMVFIGAAIVIAAGLFVIWRERQLRVRRRREVEASPIGPLLP